MKRYMVGLVLSLALILGTAAPSMAASGTVTDSEYNNIFLYATIKSHDEAGANVVGTKVCVASVGSAGGPWYAVSGYRYASSTPGTYVFVRWVEDAAGWYRLQKKWWRSTKPSDLCYTLNTW